MDVSKLHCRLGLVVMMTTVMRVSVVAHQTTIVHSVNHTLMGTRRSRRTGVVSRSSSKLVSSSSGGHG